MIDVRVKMTGIKLFLILLVFKSEPIIFNAGINIISSGFIFASYIKYQPPNINLILYRYNFKNII